MPERKEKRVIVPVDGSPASMHAVDIADVAFKREHIAPVYVIVVPPKYTLDTELPSEEEKAERALSEAEETLKKGHHEESEGDLIQSRSLGPAILDEAEDIRVSTIVIGVEGNERGKNGLGRTTNRILNKFPGIVAVARAPLKDQNPIPRYNVVRLPRRKA